MPTEHEYKYVLDIAAENENLTEFSSYLGRTHIQQAYLAPDCDYTLRVRCENDQDWYFVFKMRTEERQIEIQQKIDSRDGRDLWSHAPVRMEKYRYRYRIDGLVWELDILRDVDHTYFVQLEVEMPEGSNPPPAIPDFLQRHLLWEVPLTDDACSNKKLADVEYATNLLKGLKDGYKT